VFTGGPDVVDGTGQSRRGPQQSAGRIGQDLHVHPVFLVLAGVEGAVRGDAVDEQQGAVQQHECLRRCRTGCLLEGWGKCGQELDGLGDVPVGGRGADAEPAASWAYGWPLRRWARVSRACRPGLRRRHRVPSS
jgi:hypothetical protein